MEYYKQSSKSISGLFFLIRSPEPNASEASRASESCIYIGNSMLHSMPAFLDISSSMNPHIFIFGMTGSGKSYLMKNLMLKLSIFSESLMLVVDFTGEYAEFARFAGCIDADPPITKLLEGSESGIIYMNLHVGLPEHKKVEIADSALREATEYMRLKGQKKMYIILDEAWKLLSHSGTLGILLREGRKYGCGIIMASQNVEDIAAPLLSNVANVFIFRLQDRQSLERLSENYMLSAEDLSSIQQLGVGSCMLVQLHSKESKDSFIIGHVEGVSIDKTIRLSTGGKMEIKVGRSELERFVSEVAGNSAAAGSVIGDGEYVDAADMIAKLIAMGADKHAILSGLSKIGMSDSAIADAFSAAIAIAKARK